MAIQTGPIPPTPLDITIAPVIGYTVPGTSTITLTAPTSATLITGMSTQITVPTAAQWLEVEVYLPSVTVSAAATTTLSLYQGATAGALTTVVQTIAFITPTGGTQFAGFYKFLVPTAAAGASFPDIGSTVFLSVAATSSTGNFVVNATSTQPSNMIVKAL